MSDIDIENACIAVGYTESERPAGPTRLQIQTVIRHPDNFGEQRCGARSPNPLHDESVILSLALQLARALEGAPGLLDADPAQINAVIESYWPDRDIAVHKNANVDSGCKPVTGGGWSNVGRLPLYVAPDSTTRATRSVGGKDVPLSLFIEWSCVV